MAASEARTILNRRQQAFCRHVAAGASGAEAARAAGYRDSNARQQASKLLGQADVIEAIEELRRERNAAHAASLERALTLTQQIIEGAMRQGKWHAALRGLELELKLRKQGAAPGPHVYAEWDEEDPDWKEDWADEWPPMPKMERPEIEIAEIEIPEIETPGPAGPPNHPRSPVALREDETREWLPPVMPTPPWDDPPPRRNWRSWPPINANEDWNPLANP